MAFVLKRIIASSATISRSAVAVAVPFRRSSAVDTNQRRPLFSDVFSRFSSSSATKGPLPHTILPPQHEVPKVVSLIESTPVRITSECFNMIVPFVVALRPDIAQFAIGLAAVKGIVFTTLRRNKFDNNRLHQQKEFPVYRYTCDKVGLKLFVQVHGLGKQDLRVIIFDDSLHVASNAILPSGKKMKGFIPLPIQFDFDPNEITADIVEGGELMIYIPFGKKNEEATEPTVFQLKLN